MDEQTMMAALQRLTKWRSVFAGWQLGTRTSSDPECQAVRDHREVTILLRAEVNAITKLLLDKGVFTTQEFQRELEQEAEDLSSRYEGKFPGIKATDYGIQYTNPEAAETMKNWPR
jgi:hypothetical protein